MLIESALVFALSCLISFAVTPFFRSIAFRLQIIDRPNQLHKTHSIPVPYLGGWSIIFTLGTGVTILLFWRREAFGNPTNVALILAVPLVLAFVGLIDDMRNLGPLSRLFAQTLGSVFVASVFVKLDLFGTPSGIRSIDVVVSILWIVGITNSLNFIDNLDGGAGGVVLISSAVLAFMAIAGDQLDIALLATLIAGSTLGFLFWNLNPARIYLGDSGALFLGSILAILIIRLDPPTANSASAWFLALSLVAVPILDTSVAVISRVSRGLSPIQGGRDHLSHRLLAIGFSKRQTASIIWTLQFGYCSLGVLIIYSDARESIWLGIFIALSWLSLLIWFLGRGIEGTTR